MENIAYKINHKSPFFPPLLFSLETFRVRCIYCTIDVAFGLPRRHMVRNQPSNAGHARESGSILGSGRSPGGGHGNPLQCSCLENSMDRGAWQAIVHGVAKIATCLSDSAHTESLLPTDGRSPGRRRDCTQLGATSPTAHSPLLRQQGEG